MEVIAATERITGRSVPWEIGAAARRRPGRHLRRPDAGRRDCSTGSRRTDLDDIVASAWNWHSTHLDGYDESPSP